MTDRQAQTDARWMREALIEAAKGAFTASPNPRVGCVIVKDGQVIGKGYHVADGLPHAEINALNDAKAKGHDVANATVYVTLEPCAHYGRTGPCVDALIAAHVGRVVVAIEDPDPRVASKGIQKLTDAGILLTLGVCSEAAKKINRGFLSRIQRQRPWVRLKAAVSLDGNLALLNGVSQWLTGPTARRDNQWFRAEADAIVTGIGTVLADNPRMTVRDETVPQQPLRVVLDTHFQFPEEAAMIDGSPVLVAVAQDNLAKRERLAAKNVTVEVLPIKGEHIDLSALMRLLNERAINLVHVEAGSKLNGAFLAEHLADELLLYQSPKVVGCHAQGLFNVPALTTLDHAPRIDIESCELMDVDVRIRGVFMYETVATNDDTR